MNSEISNARSPDPKVIDRDTALTALGFISSILLSLDKSQELTTDVDFWKWLQKINQTGFASSSSIQTLAQKSPEYLKNTLRSKGMEYAWTSNYNIDPLNFFSVAKLSESPNDPIGDAYIKDFFTGKRQPVQMKTSKTIPNDPTRTSRNANRHLRSIRGRYPEGTLIIGNKPVVEAAKGNPSYDHKAYPIESGWSGKEETRFVTSKYEKAQKGKASPALTTKAVILNIAKTALVGALLFSFIEVIKDWRIWRDGQITGEEFITRILKQGGKGALLGGGTGILILLLSSL